MKIRISSSTDSINYTYFWDDSTLFWDSDVNWDAGEILQKPLLKTKILNDSPKIGIRNEKLKIKI